MPRYVRSKKGEMERKEFKGFSSVAQMNTFLARCDAKTWKTYTRLAKDYLDGRKTPPRKLRKAVLRKIIKYNPQKLLHHVNHEVFQHKRKANSKLGGGITEAVSSLTHEASNLLGLPKLWDFLGIGPNRKELGPREKEFAQAVDETYTDMSDRPDTIGSLTRLPEYDTDLISVWHQRDGEAFIAVRGTKLNLKNLSQDVALAGGREGTTNSEVENIMDRMDASGVKYDVGAHSLGTSYVYNALKEHGKDIDEIFLFNPASSPFQSDKYLKGYNDDERIKFFVNEGDMVSSGIYQKLSKDTLENRTTIGPYRWSPLAAHSAAQWYDDEDKDTDEKEEDVKSEKKISHPRVLVV